MLVFREQNILGGNMKNELNRGEMVIYTAPNGVVELKVKVGDDTVWLTQAQMSELFGKDIRTISEHINNIFKEKELFRNSVIRNFRITAADGKSYNTLHYNLDVIISVGYRVKSLQGTKFRIWANTILKNYLVNGYVLNEQKLLEDKDKHLNNLLQLVNYIQTKSNNPELLAKNAEVFTLISEYMQAWKLLEQYDRQNFEKNKVTQPIITLTYAKSIQIIAEMKDKLILEGIASNLFGEEISNGLARIIGTIYQTFDGNDLYTSAEEKASHLLYFVIKDHPFADGNKRIGSILFLHFLKQNLLYNRADGLPIFSSATIATLALLIALSDPKEKGVIIKLVMSLIQQ